MKGIVFASALLLSPALAAAQQTGAEQGRALFQRQCASCHQISSPRHGVGPTLQGVSGRAAGSVEGFNYSPAMKNSGVTWSAETLETYLTNPTGMIRGSRMVNRVPNEQQRRDIIDFLTSGQ